jgi:hypothetical protein
MNRYILFAGADYYPSGGWRDVVASYPTLEDALNIAAGITDDWWHIVDAESGDIVKFKP